MNEEGYVISCRHKVLAMICKYTELGAVFGLIAGAALIYFQNDYGKNYFYNLAMNTLFLHYIAIAIGVICLIATIFIKVKFINEPKLDDWVFEIASRRVSSRYALYDNRLHYLDYDISLKHKDINELILEINDKSEKYTYYMGKVDIDKGLFELRAVKRSPIPDKATLNIETDDKNWNNIPLGLAVNKKLQQVSPIAWKLNDTIKDKELIDTLPSVSLLITGGTGSGKSVFENAIIGHISRYPDRFQAVACDVKIIEFIRLEGLKGIKRIALTVKECDEAIKQMQIQMMKRFQMMKKYKVNNIYDIEGIDCDYYELNGEQFQFDEMFPCKLNGEFQILQICEIYDALDQGKDVEIIGQAEELD